MNETHLTPMQLDAILIGDRDEAAIRHLEACAVCASELATVHSSIAALNGTLTNMAKVERFRRNTHTSLLTPRAPSHRPIFRLTATLALAASVAIVAAVLPVGRLMHPPTAQQPVIVAATPTHPAESDEALLTEIDQQLSASVPEALAPLEDPTKDPTATTNKQN